jgi:hypothetical protein
MNTSLFGRTNGVFQYPYDGVTDFSALTGSLVANSATAGLLVANTSATVPAVAVCLDGQGAQGVPSNMGVLGAIPPVRLIAHGAINKFQRVQQDATGGIVADAGAGNQRVVIGVALEAAVNGQYVLVQTIAPQPASTW